MQSHQFWHSNLCRGGNCRRWSATPLTQGGGAPGAPFMANHLIYGKIGQLNNNQK